MVQALIQALVLDHQLKSLVLNQAPALHTSAGFVPQAPLCGLHLHFGSTGDLFDSLRALLAFF